MLEVERSQSARSRSGLWLVLALSLCACFSSHGPKNTTETGTPPVIDSGHVALQVTSSEVRIRGDKGAVMPGGTPIEITNLNTGVITHATANADGSFDVKVDGSSDDAFAVRASSDQGGAKSSPVYVVRGGAAVGSGKDGSLSCEQRDALAGAVLERAAAEADKSCNVDADCQAVIEVASCHDRCQYEPLSLAGQKQLETTGAAIDAGLCANNEKDGCKALFLPCVSPPPVTCSAGQCTRADQGSPSCDVFAAMDQIAQAEKATDRSCMIDSDCVLASTATSCWEGCDGDIAVSRAGKTALEAAVSRIDQGPCASSGSSMCKALASCVNSPPTGDPICMGGQCIRSGAVSNPNDCTTCLLETIEWGPNGGLVAYSDSSVLMPCVHYVHTRHPPGDPTAAILSCEADFVACNSIATSGAVLSALANADVQQALTSSPVLYGTDSRGVDGTVFEIKVGSRVIDVGGPCNGVPPNCIPVPAGVQALVDLLRGIDTGELATPACKDFAPAPTSCPPDRKLAIVCTACGPAGGCTTSTTCAKVCSSNSDCAAGANGPMICGSQQVCETGPCI